MDKEKIDIIVYSESLSFTKIFTENSYFDETINLVRCVSSISELVRANASSENAVFILYTAFMSSDNIDDIVEYFESISASFLAVCDDPNEGFIMLKKGALCALVKTDDDSKYGIAVFCRHLSLKIKDAYKIKMLSSIRVAKKTISVNSNKIIAIGSSTGGTEAIVEILKELPEASPPILIVQHMPPVFTKMFADRLNNICKISVMEAKDGDKVEPGTALLAPGDYQMKIATGVDGLFVRCFKGEKVNGHAPSVDVLFNSMAEIVAKRSIGVILTGMGADGSKGLLAMKNNGAHTIGQDEQSCIVYGMPKAAFEIGAVDEQVSLHHIAEKIISLF